MFGQVNLSFLFWNLNGKPLWDRLASIVERHNVDIVMLAECPKDGSSAIQELNTGSQKRFYLAQGGLGKLQIFTHLPERTLTPVFDDGSGRLTIRRLQLLEHDVDMLVAVTHLPSKTYYNESELQFVATEIANFIKFHEDRLSIARTVLVGDFNMNPFEGGVVGAAGLHAVMTRAIAAELKRTISTREYRYFYNPMWSCFGDRSDGPAGTYYYPKSTPISYFWNIFDQVLLRPEIMDWLKELRILDHDGSSSLLDAHGLPDKTTGSDHLPLYFCLQP
jgi:hypothetical protein